MTLRSLLVPVSGHAADEITLETALELARAFEAHLSAICIRPDPTDVVRYVAEWSYPILIEDAVATAQTHAADMAGKAAALFDGWRKRHRLPAPGTAAGGVSLEWEERVGESGAVLRDLARFADLTVMRGLGEKGPVEGDGMLEAVLFDAGRPVLLAPAKGRKTIFGTALIAWDGGPEALHAVTASLPILARSRHVKVLSVNGDPHVKAADLIIYLHRHQVHADLVEITAAGGAVGAAVLTEARRLDADLLVMGAYRHSRMREVMFGGTTRHIVTNVELPVLMAH
jgi:nucleotide-binding universal stress UspA family protein